jgi:hypothetical protein
MDRTLFAIISCSAVVPLIGLADALCAQEPNRAGSPLIPHVAAAGALDLRNGETRHQPMYLGLTTLEWSTRVPGLGLRLDGVYAGRREDFRLWPQFEPGARVVTENVYYSKVRGQGAFAGATYELVHRGRFRPYALAGVGAIRTHEKSVTGTTTLCTAICLAEATMPTTRNERPLNGAAQAGVGAVYTWRWVSVVAETRYFAVANRNVRGLNGALPLSLGVRF